VTLTPTFTLPPASLHLLDLCTPPAPPASPPAPSKVTAKISARSSPPPSPWRALTLTTPPSPPPPSPPPPPSRLATLTTTTLALAAPTPQVVAKISVGEAPDLIKLAKTEHLTPIEERIKDLHESMNASQHGSDAPHGQYPDLAPAPLHGARADHGRLGTPRRRGQPIGRPATARVLELAASHTRRFHAIDPQAVRDMQDQMREQDEVRQ